MPESSTMRIEIVTPYEMFFEGQVEMVVMTSKDGELGVMPGHAPLMVALVPGEIRIKANGEWRALAATNGYAEVAGDITMIIVNAAEWADQIDAKRAKEAYERAVERLHNPATPVAERIHARHAVQRAHARLHVAEKYRDSHHSTPV